MRSDVASATIVYIIEHVSTAGSAGIGNANTTQNTGAGWCSTLADTKDAATTMNFRAKALEYWKEGHRIIPIFIDPSVYVDGKYKSKKPCVQQWKPWQTEAQTREEFDRLNWNKANAIGTICGIKHKNDLYFSVIDIDDKNFDLSKARAEKSIRMTRFVKSVSGGLHAYYYSKTAPTSKPKKNYELKGVGNIAILEGDLGGSAKYKALNANPISKVTNVNLDFEVLLKSCGLLEDEDPREETQEKTEQKLNTPKHYGEPRPCILEAFKHPEKVDECDNRHYMRLYMATDLIKCGYSEDDAVNMFQVFSDFNKGKTRNQVRSVKIEKRARCDTISKLGFCLKEQCKYYQCRPKTLIDVHIINEQWLHLTEEDKEYLEVVYACAIDRDIPGDPIWMYLIAPPGGTKTTAARAINQYKKVYSIDDLTKSTLISGLAKMDKKNEEMIPIAGILQHLDGKVLVVKDFTTILAKQKDERNEIFGQLRAVYDGYFEKAFGTLPQPIRVKATIGLILCVTPVIDKYIRAHVALGERLLKIRQQPNSKDTAKRSYQNMGKEKEMRRQLVEATAYYLNTLDFETLPTITEDQADQIIDLSLLVAKGRAPVFCTYYGGQIVDMDLVEPEIPTRLVKQLKKLVIALAIIRKHKNVTAEDMKTLCRVAQDTMNQKRLKIIEAMYKLNQSALPGTIAKEAVLHHQSTANELEKMKALNMVTTNDQSYILTNECHSQFNLLAQLLWGKGVSSNLEDKKGNTIHTLHPNQLPTQNQNVVIFRQIPAAEPCDKCHMCNVEYIIHYPLDSTVRRCKDCFIEQCGESHLKWRREIREKIPEVMT